VERLQFPPQRFSVNLVGSPGLRQRHDNDLGGQWQSIDYRIGSQCQLDPPLELDGIRLIRRRFKNQDDSLVSAVLVPHANQGTPCNAGDLLDLPLIERRIDVAAAANDHVLCPPEKNNLALIIEARWSPEPKQDLANGAIVLLGGQHTCALANFLEPKRQSVP
jgi:hypothetical protein